ncbi:hypothetical protein BGZ75_007346 [Mortierella antarctica]|nr:hypothetical protein BGZ75_007346 [Mortierella antarctica]
MLFKPKFTAALLMCLGLAAQHNAVNAQSTEVAPEADSGIIGDVIWPVAFNDMCQTLLASTNNFDSMIAYAKTKGYSCTAAQTTAIGGPGKCNPLTLVISVLWPLAFDQQKILGNRIKAQSECLKAIIVR